MKVPTERSTLVAALEAGTRAWTARIGFVPLLILVSLALLLPGFSTLPPMDRDEPRFAQASKQMLETSDFVDIRFGEEARNKKPVGIYWMQSASVKLAEIAGVPDARQRIWIYRLPSLAGALAAVLLTYWTALAFTTPPAAALSALLLAATVLLGVEARLATTDAIVVATVTAAMGALARAYVTDDPDRRCSLGVAALFWTAIGVGILVKGPITPLVPLLASLALSIRSRSVRWLSALRPLAGLIWCALIVLPWFVLILMRTHGAFLADSVGHDMMGKVAGAQEMHGMPPGSYLASFLLAGWPLAPFVVLAAAGLWRARGDRAIAFLLAWLVPAWLLFEAVPTKLFHYVLPLYPALAILAVLGMEQRASAGRSPGSIAAWLLFGLLALVPAAILVLVVVLRDRLWTLDAVTVVAAVAAAGTSFGLAWQARRSLVRGATRQSVVFGAACALPIYLFAFGRLLTPSVADRMAVSPQLASAAAAALTQCPEPLYATISYREPSLMFLTNTRLLATDAAGAAAFLAEGPCRAVFVGAADEPAFEAALDPAVPVSRAAAVKGTSLNGGGKLDIGVYVRQ